jgi:hypothetical protein
MGGNGPDRLCGGDGGHWGAGLWWNCGAARCHRRVMKGAEAVFDDRRR